MTKLEKDKLRETVAAETVAAAQAEPVPEPQADQSQSSGVAVAGLVGVVGNIVCRRAGVSLLSPAEADALGAATDELLKVYGVTIDNPVVAAWLAMGAAVGCIVIPRMDQFTASRAAAVTAANANEPEIATVVPQGGGYDEMFHQDLSHVTDGGV